MSIVDKAGREIGTMVPGPESPDWKADIDAGADLCDEAREEEGNRFAAGEKDHRRGHFPFVARGASNSNGRLVRSYIRFGQVPTEMHPDSVREC